MEKSYYDKDLLTLLDRIPDLINYQKFYEKIKYLHHLEEENKHDLFIYEIYETSLQTAGTSLRPFSNFTAKNHETFTRLKWRWVNKHLQKKGMMQGQDEEKKILEAPPSYT